MSDKVEQFRSWLSLSLLVITFVFLPSDNWSRWFLRHKSDWYGELQLERGDSDLIIAKNALDETVGLFAATKQAWAYPFDSNAMLDLGLSKEVPAKSITLLELGGNDQGEGGEGDSELRHVGGVTYFRPYGLSILVPAEQAKWLFMVGGLLVAAGALVYIGTSYYEQQKRLQ